MTFDEWIKAGVQAGWISAPVCATHDGTPTSAAEDAEYDAGFDPCTWMVRVYGDDEATRTAVEENFAPAVWRRTNEGL